MQSARVFPVAVWAGVFLLVGACGALAEHPHGRFRLPDHPYQDFRASLYVAPYAGHYGIYDNPGWGPYYLPPSYVPAEQGFGPQAVRQFMGLDQNVAAIPQVPARRPGVGDAGANTVRADQDRPPPAINLTARARARKAMSWGDDLFRRQRFQEALQQYKAAATADPNFAEAYFRQGHALVATNRCDLAAAAFKRALKLRPNLDRDGFRLPDLYGDNQIAKTAHLEVLARRAFDQPQDTDAYFLVGLFLRYDGQAERAQKFFARAKTLAGAADAHLRGFLPAAKRRPITLAGGVAT
jgi:tetratricopeptide (TPR) repeat protein